MKKDKKSNNSRTGTAVSATFYLSKFQEFSENVLARDGLGLDVELGKTLSFIREILLADAVVLTEILSGQEAGLLKAVVNNESVSGTLDEKQIKLLRNLFDEVYTFNAEDDGSREVVGQLFDKMIPMSGFSVPIKSEKRLQGVLSVYYTLNVPATESKIHFLKSMASVLFYLRQSQELLSQVDIKHARQIFDAKREWEGTVDSLEQLIIVLDENARVIRANKAIQYWEIDGFDAVIGNDIERVITSLSGEDIRKIYPSWSKIWAQLNEYQHIEWKSETGNSQILRFSLRKIINEPATNKKLHQGYGVLFVEDITKSTEAEKQIKNYATHLESALKRRNEELERVNEQLRTKLDEQNRTRSELAKSEEKYHTLCNFSLSGICQLEGGRIIFHNNRFSEIFKYSDDQLNNCQFIDLFAEEEQEFLLTFIDEIKEIPESDGVKNVKAHDAYGRDIWLKISLSCATLLDNTNIIVNVVDITRLKDIEISLRESEERLQKTSGKLINAQEIERKRLALELHDGLGQSLSTIKYSIEELRRKVMCDGDKSYIDTLDSMVVYIKDTIDETRRMAMDLRPPMLDDLGIISTINWFCRQYNATYKNIGIDKQIFLEENEIMDSRKIVIYRVIQEALNNVAKHSGADTVCIKLRKLDEHFIQLLIADNGCGIKTKVSSITTGLSGMRERVELTGGSFMLMDNEPRGVKIDVRWPAESAALIA